MFTPSRWRRFGICKKEMAAIMRSNPELNVLGIIDQDDNIVEGYDNFINYLNSFK
jgi:hypothetical protein